MSIGRIDSATAILVVIVSLAAYFINLGHDVSLMKNSHNNSVHTVSQLVKELIDLKKDFQAIRSDSDKNYESIAESNRRISEIKDKLTEVAVEIKISLKNIRENQ